MYKKQGKYLELRGIKFPINLARWLGICYLIFTEKLILCKKEV